MASREESIYFLRAWLLVSQPPSREWSPTPKCMDGTNLSAWVIIFKEEKRHDVVGVQRKRCGEASRRKQEELGWI